MASTFEIGHRYEKLIADLIAAGVYNNKSEVVRDALRQLERSQLRWDDLRRMAEEASADPRPDVDAASFFDALKLRYSESADSEARNKTSSGRGLARDR